MGIRVLSDAPWTVLEPLVLEVRPRGRTPHRDMRHTTEAILRCCRCGVPWRDVPPELGERINAAQTFICRAKRGVWERLLDLA